MLVPMFSKNIYGSFKINSALGIINPQKKAWMPAVFVQEQPPLYVSLATGALVLILRFSDGNGNWKKMEDVFPMGVNITTMGVTSTLN